MYRIAFTRWYSDGLIQLVGIDNFINPCVAVIAFNRNGGRGVIDICIVGIMYSFA